MLSLKGRPAYACWLTLLSLPPAGCSGVEVRGIDIRDAPGAKVYGGGTVTVPMVRLVGVWNGAALTLTEPPHMATRAEASAFATGFRSFGSCRPSDAYADGQAEAVKTSIDFDQGIKPKGTFALQGLACGHSVHVLLAVAEPTAIDYLNERYLHLLAVRGGRLEISGWLQPVAA